MTQTASGPAGRAMLRLSTDLPAALEPLLSEWRGAGADVVLAELSESAEPQYADLVKAAEDRVPGWTISSYRQVFPVRGVLLPGDRY